ncbi:hypothetical protein Tco_0714969 [Tanacetum coccineum]
METKDTLSSCSNLEEQQMQQIQDKAKKSCMVSFQLLHSHLKLLSNNNLKRTRIEDAFKRAFATLFHQDVEIFTSTMFLNTDQLEKQLHKEEFQEIGSMAAFRVPTTQFQKFIKPRISLNDKDGIMARKYFLEYTKLEGKVDMSTTLAASLVDTQNSETESKEEDTSSRSGNDAHADDADFRPIYNEEPMDEVQTIAEINVFDIGQQHTEQPEFNNEGEVDQNGEKRHDTRPLPSKLTDNQITELSNQSLKQHGQFLKAKSNETNVKHDIDVIETINIKLEHKVAKLLETLKKHYKELYDSIKATRTKTIEQTTSLIAKNTEFKAQLQEKGFAIAVLK